MDFGFSPVNTDDGLFKRAHTHVWSFPRMHVRSSYKSKRSRFFLFTFFIQSYSESKCTSLDRSPRPGRRRAIVCAKKVNIYIALMPHAYHVGRERKQHAT